MTDTQTILKMIETVDPSDTAKLDEIDARVWCWLHGHRFDPPPRKYKDTQNFAYYPSHELDAVAPYVGTVGIECSRYTRSRDALKAIRPEGWKFTIYTHIASCRATKWLGWSNTSLCETEELAELHAIIQAIEYSRTSDRGE